MVNIESVIESRQGSIKIVRYNRPHKKNAMDENMYLRVTEILNDAALDSEIDMVVLTGTGDYYSSGNDITARKQSSWLKVFEDFVKAFITFPKSLIAVVNGPAIGVAVTTLALCDLVFAIENAYFYTPFSKLGVNAEGCSTITFPRLMGDRKAAAMLLYSQKMMAPEALDCGFVNYLYRPDELPRVWEKITEVSELCQESIVTTKSLMRRNMQEELIKQNEIEVKELQKVWENTGTKMKFFNKNAHMSKL